MLDEEAEAPGTAPGDGPTWGTHTSKAGPTRSHVSLKGPPAPFSAIAVARVVSVGALASPRTCRRVTQANALPADTLGGGPMAVAWAWATLPRRGGAAGGFDIYIKSDVRDPLSTT